MIIYINIYNFATELPLGYIPYLLIGQGDGGYRDLFR